MILKHIKKIGGGNFSFFNPRINLNLIMQTRFVHRCLMESPFSFGSGQFNISSRGRRIERPWAPVIFSSEMYKIENLWVLLWTSRIQIWRKLCALCAELKLIRSCGFMNNEDLRSIRIFRPSELDLQHWAVSWPKYHPSVQNRTTIFTISEGKKPLLSVKKVWIKDVKMIL